MNVGTIMAYAVGATILIVYLFPQPDSPFTAAIPMMWCTCAICFAIGGIEK